MTTAVSAIAASGEFFAASRLERVFARCFSSTLNTRLEGGRPEPLYLPATRPGEPHRLYYREDFFASALHEVAHWCIAGPERRRQVDFGYWYTADGRSCAQQQAFEAVEYKPQALEWLFCQASGFRFRISLDNLDGLADGAYDAAPFARRVQAQARHWQRDGLPERAALFSRGLALEFGTHSESRDFVFDLAELA